MRAIRLFLASLVVIVGTVAVAGQSGPFAAQIQQALRVFLTEVHTWTALQTFSGGISVSSCSGCGSGGVTSVGLTMPSGFTVSGSPVTTTGTLGVSLAAGGVSTLLDTIGSTRGSVLYRGSTGWAILIPGPSGDVFEAQGTGADPIWNTPSGIGLGDFSSNTLTSVDGEAVVFNGTSGKSGRRATGTGVATLTSGVIGTATIGSGITFSGGTLSSNDTLSIGFTVDGAGSPITTGTKGFIYTPASCSITSATVLSTDASVTAGSIVIDVWKAAIGSYPPTVSNTITASAKPTLSSATNATDSTLTGWTRSVSAGDVLGFHVDSASTVTRVTLVLGCKIS